MQFLFLDFLRAPYIAPVWFLQPNELHRIHTVRTLDARGVSITRPNSIILSISREDCA